MREPERDLRAEWERFFAEQVLIEASRKASPELFEKLGREAARRKEAAVFAALLGDSQ